LSDDEPFMFAGLFSVWKGQKGEEVASYTIITTEPNTLLATIHNRMPVILPPQHHEQWLDRENRETDKLQKLLVSYPARSMKAYAVSRIVSSSQNNVQECMEPLP